MNIYYIKYSWLSSYFLISIKVFLLKSFFSEEHAGLRFFYSNANKNCYPCFRIDAKNFVFRPQKVNYMFLRHFF